MTINLMPIETDNWIQDSDPVTTILNSGIKLTYPQHLEGGCFWLKDEFISIIKKIKKEPYFHCFEWCSGLGGIGFEILGNNLCKKITFSDYYNVAIENCLENAVKNNLSNVVAGYITPTISEIPDNEIWDLVIGTPPHCFDAEEQLTHLSTNNKDLTGSLSASNWARLTIDDGMEIHKEFFKNIKKHLTNNADILIFGNTNQENALVDLARSAELKLIKTYSVKRYGIIYYLKPL